jgi:hypothetical protein
MAAHERRRGRPKVFLGAAAGVGKTFTTVDIQSIIIIADREGRSDDPQR